MNDLIENPFPISENFQASLVLPRYGLTFSEAKRLTKFIESLVIGGDGEKAAALVENKKGTP